MNRHSRGRIFSLLYRGFVRHYLVTLICLTHKKSLHPTLYHSTTLLDLNLYRNLYYTRFFKITR